MSVEISFPAFVILWNKLQKQGTPAIHLRLASWIAQKWETGERRMLVMAFRAFGKSTLIGLFCTWVLWRNPDLRILVLAADLALSRKMVRQVKRIIEKHPLTRHLKPDRLDQWGAECFTLKRTTELRDPTMLAKSITTNLTGTRADLIICDDVEVPKTCDTVHKRTELRERLTELDYILTPGGGMIYVGTPHHWQTIYANETRKGEDLVFLDGFLRIVIPILNEAGESAWPERYSLEKIEAVKTKTGPSHFASQMMCQPVNLTDGRFDTDDLIVYTEAIEYSESGQLPVLTIEGKKLVSGIAWWDPAFGREDGDKSVLAIVYTDEDGKYWLHHLQAIIVQKGSVIPEAEQQCRKIAELIETYFIPLIAIEVNGIGQFLPGLLRKELGNRGMSCGVLEVTSRKAKNTRIREAFEVVLANRALHVHKTALANSFLKEMQDWSPNKKSQADDALDAVAGALSLQPVRIKRVFGTNKQNWQGGAKMRKAKTVLD